MNLAHVINVFNAAEGSEHAIAIPIVCESVKIASKNSHYNVELIGIATNDDISLIPSFFNHKITLKRSVSNVGTFSQPEELPLISDIIDAALNSSDAEWIIYTNSDIILHPTFYDFVSKQINSGLDAFIINRRGISTKYNSVAQLDEIVEQQGVSHPGFDCFIFKREIANRLELGNICVGIPHIEKAMLLNLIAHSNKFKLFDEEYVTFHIGETVLKNWGPKEYWAHNKREYNKVVAFLLPNLDIRKFPYYECNIFKRYWRWIWNPNFYFFFNFKLEWKMRLGIGQQ